MSQTEPKKHKTADITNHIKAYLAPFIQMFKPHWHPDYCAAKVVRKHRLSERAYTLILSPKGKWPTFQAGQFIEVIAQIKGRWESRCFSISSSPAHFEQSGQIEVSFMVNPNGQQTSWMADQLSAGTTVSISRAYGEFTLDAGCSAVVALAAGSGITPLYSMLQQLADTDSQRPMHLIYFAQTPQAHWFAQELKQLAIERDNISVQLLTPSQHGRFSSALIPQEWQQGNTRFYLCGPERFMQATRSELTRIGIDNSRITQEWFTSATAQRNNDTAVADVTFSTQGVTQTSRHVGGESLLEFAESLGLNPTYGCRQGVCHQCSCEKKSGIVRNRRTGEYSTQGAETIRLCVSIPVGSVSVEV